LRPLAAGQLAFRESEDEFAAFYPVIWEATGDRRFIFESRIAAAPFRAQTASFRTSLMVGLGAVVVLLMAVQAAAIAIGLEPVQRMARRVREVEAGERTAMGDDYPPELRGLAANIDRFIGHESASRDRYRKAMEDLAHSLKTPLAVLRNALHGHDPLLEEQVDRMEVTVTHQLSRARAARPPLLVRPVLLRPLCERLVRALERAYADKAIHSDIRIDADASVRCDERDLMEMIGNLLENAFKFGRTRVRISTGPGASVLVEDDGPGVPEALRDEVLARGARADTAVGGQGIGLAVVVDLAVSYGGRVSIRDSALGGAAVLLELP